MEQHILYMYVSRELLLHIWYRPSLLHSYLCNQKIVTYVLQPLYNIIISVSTQT